MLKALWALQLGLEGCRASVSRRTRRQPRALVYIGIPYGIGENGNRTCAVVVGDSASGVHLPFSDATSQDQATIN